MMKRFLLLSLICLLAGCGPEKNVVKTDNKQLSRDYSIHNEILMVNPGVFAESQPWQSVSANLKRKVFFNDRQTMVLYDMTKTDKGKDVNTQYHYHELSGYVLNGNLLIKFDTKVQSIGPGGVYVIPSNVHYAVLPLTQKVLFMEVFTPARDDLRSPPILLRFDENDVKSVIYKWYAYLDKLADASNYLPLMVNRGMVIHMPGSVIRTQDEFKTWYAGMIKKIKINTSKVNNVIVTIDENSNFVAEFNVSWEAVTTLDERRTFQSRQKWTFADQGGATPVIMSADYKETNPLQP